ncbi:hypothetical protein KGQ72_01250 [Patescibacteria group bacterium]|nr:hypothetical protein [Patescibacteria group bacterium]MBU6491127.1 hypothetical protein [Patescibacteria group bacterium]
MIDSIFNFSSVPVTTNISPHTEPLGDYARLNKLIYHIETDDYFRFLSTLLGFVEETLADGNHGQDDLSIQLEAIRATRKDLAYLNDHYRITSRP